MSIECLESIMSAEIYLAFASVSVSSDHSYSLWWHWCPNLCSSGELVGHKDLVSGFSFCQHTGQGHICVSSSADGIIRFWDTDSKTLLKEHAAHQVRSHWQLHQQHKASGKQTSQLWDKRLLFFFLSQFRHCHTIWFHILVPSWRHAELLTQSEEKLNHCNSTGCREQFSLCRGTNGSTHFYSWLHYCVSRAFLKQLSKQLVFVFLLLVLLQIIPPGDTFDCALFDLENEPQRLDGIVGAPSIQSKWAVGVFAQHEWIRHPFIEAKIVSYSLL